MWRLRTTTALSLLMLAVGIGGTHWLSGLTAGWRGPAASALASAAQPVPVRVRRLHHRQSPRWHGPVSVVQARRPPATRAAISEPAAVAAAALVPVSVPDDTDQRWDALRGHLDGRVVLHVDVDGAGQVRAARVARSSGDAVLDQHALRSVHGWRFAVPAGSPDGISGELPMRFASSADRVASAP